MSHTVPTTFRGLPRMGSDTRRPYGVPAAPRPAAPQSDGVWSVDAVLRILLEPSSYFRSLAGACRFSPAASFAMVHAALMAAVGFVAGALGARAQLAVSLDTAGIIHLVGACAAYAAAFAIGALVLSVAAASVLHPVAALGGGRCGFAATYAATVYAATPAAILAVCGFCVAELYPEAAAFEAWLTVAGAIWSCVLCAIALYELHRLSGVSAVLVGSVPLTALAAAAIWCYAPELLPGPMSRAAGPACSLRVVAHNVLPGVPWAQRSIKRRAQRRDVSRSRVHNRAQNASRTAR